MVIDGGQLVCEDKCEVRFEPKQVNPDKKRENFGGNSVYNKCGKLTNENVLINLREQSKWDQI